MVLGHTDFSQAYIKCCCFHTCRMATPKTQQTQRNSRPHGKRWRQCRGCCNEAGMAGCGAGKGPCCSGNITWDRLCKHVVFASSYGIVNTAVASASALTGGWYPQ